MNEVLQFDPALRELLLRKTGYLPGEVPAEEISVEEVPVVAKIADPLVPVESLKPVARFGQIITGRVPLRNIVSVRQQKNVLSLKASQTYGPALSFSVPEIRASAEWMHAIAPKGISGGGTVIAFCDWGVDFAHDCLRNRQGHTRLLCLWDQRGGEQRDSPEPFGYGREFSRDRINAALELSDPYAALGYDPVDADPAGVGTHCTHVMDIAAGNGSVPGSSPGVAPGAELICVHLKGNDTRPEDTLGDSVRVLEAIRYVADRAGDKPLVINLSLGRTGGPHDDSPLLVQGIDNLLAERPGRAVVMSTGNYFLADVHSSGTIKQGEQRDLQWRVIPRNDEIAEMEVWYPGADSLGVELIDPEGRSLGCVPLGENGVIRDRGRVIASIYHRRHDPNNGDNQIDIFLWPDAMIGVWVTRLHGDSVRNGTYHAWIERDDPQFQSRFVPECATPITTTGTICNGRRTIAVGAYDARETFRPIAPFSSSGPSRDGRSIPAVSAPGVGIRAARSSVIRGGYRETNGLTIKSGTSMAAPHVSGTVALMFEAAGDYRLSAEQTKDILIRTARTFPPYNDTDQLRYGAGCVDAAAAVEAIQRMMKGNFEQETGTDTLLVDESEPESCLEKNPKQQVRRGTEEPSSSEAAKSEIIETVEEDYSCSRHDKTHDIEMVGKAVEGHHLVDARRACKQNLPSLQYRIPLILPRLMVEFGNAELHRIDEKGVPIYDKSQLLHFGPTGRRYKLGSGRYQYHAANFVFNTAYQLGYDVPVFPLSADSAAAGHSYNSLLVTFQALAGTGSNNGREYFARFFTIIAKPYQKGRLSLKAGDLLLCGAEPDHPFGHIALIVDPDFREMAGRFYLRKDATHGRGIHCIGVGLSIDTIEDRFGRVLLNGVGQVLGSRVVIRFNEVVIDTQRAIRLIREDKRIRIMVDKICRSIDGFSIEENLIPGYQKYLYE